METAYLAGGCFWCVEAIFQRINGITELKSGYCNGSSQNPSYESICTGQTGHAEVVKIDFDESIVSFEELLEVFIATHDPTSLNQQGADKGALGPFPQAGRPLTRVGVDKAAPFPRRSG